MHLPDCLWLVFCQVCGCMGRPTERHKAAALYWNIGVILLQKQATRMQLALNCVTPEQ